MATRFSRRFKAVFFISAVLLYFSGVGYVIFDTFVHVKGEFGNEPHPLQIHFLHLHGIAGLVFLFVFGHLFASHIRPGLRGHRRKVTGLSIFIPLAVLALTVPGLYYFGNEHLKNMVAAVHTYLGLVTVIPFGLHLWLRQSPRKPTV
ncbi:MAG TPA: hypothetical protein VHI52_08735 [Verrucomicrobiae bacterium]|nr:hypothetical protein [Verrucomicrobiae bacterium]